MKEKAKDGMIDNRRVKDSHQEGIERVKQRQEMPKGEPGKMSGKPKEKAHWRRGDSLTPRGA
jgi:hypothetical protein